MVSPKRRKLPYWWSFQREQFIVAHSSNAFPLTFYVFAFKQDMSVIPSLSCIQVEVKCFYQIYVFFLWYLCYFLSSIPTISYTVT